MRDDRVHLICRRPTWYWPIFGAGSCLVCFVAAIDYWGQGTYLLSMALVWPAVGFWPMARQGAIA
jgi:hypothetical protein